MEAVERPTRGASIFAVAVCVLMALPVVVAAARDGVRWSGRDWVLGLWAQAGLVPVIGFGVVLAAMGGVAVWVGLARD